MKRNHLIILTTFIVVFLICFSFGRTAAIKGEKNGNENLKKTHLNNDNVSSVSASAKKVAKPSADKQTQPDNTAYESDKDVTSPPERMYYPCKKEILNDYSQDAVYSKTMNDWRSHTGIDYKADKGETVTSVWEGTVKNVYKDMYWGYTVEISHDGDLISVYKNLDKKILVKKGDKVKSGQAIGKVGKSAVVEAKEDVHLHFELWTGGMPINPCSYIY